MVELFSFGESGWGDEILNGAMITLQLAIASLPIGMALAFIVAFAALSKNFLIRSLGFGYTTLMRGIPEILTLFVDYNGVGILLNFIIKLWNSESHGINFSPFIAGMIALSMVFSAYAAEVLRGAFNALDKGQVEAGQAIGMSQLQIFWRIKMPQIWRFALPGLGNLWVNLLKDTALVSIIALNDLMRMTKVAIAFTKLPFTFYLTACLIYWAMSVVSELILAKMEKNANRGIRR